jgi:hypothetical protein
LVTSCRISERHATQATRIRIQATIVPSPAYSQIDLGRLLIVFEEIQPKNSSGCPIHQYTSGVPIFPAGRHCTMSVAEMRNICQTFSERWLRTVP